MNPLNFNSYTYVLNNPLKYADKAGLWVGNKAKVNVINTNIGTLGNGLPTNVINDFRKANGTIHGSPSGF